MGSMPTDDTKSFQETIENLFTVENIENFRDSCPVTLVIHGGMGMIGLFLAGFSSGPEMNMMKEQASLPLKTQIKMAAKDMGTRTFSSAKNFAVIGAIFSGSECVLEGYRAKKDIYNTLSAGCFTGGLLGAKSGPKAALFGCGGFAAFSAAIEHFLQDRM